MIRSLAIIALALAAGTNAHAAASCDRACLKSTLDAYLTALVKHDPKAAPLSLGFRQTENAQVRSAGTGLWQSATALGKVQRRYFDAVSEQAAYFGTLDEAVGPAIATLRLMTHSASVILRSSTFNRSVTMAGPAASSSVPKYAACSVVVS